MLHDYFVIKQTNSLYVGKYLVQSLHSFLYNSPPAQRLLSFLVLIINRSTTPPTDSHLSILSLDCFISFLILVHISN